MSGGVGQNAIERTASGLYVPAGTKEKKQRVLHRDAFKKFRRLFNDLRVEGMTAIFYCNECKQPVHLRLEDRLVETASGLTPIGELTDVQVPGGRPVLSCSCSEWTVR